MKIDAAEMKSEVSIAIDLADVENQVTPAEQGSVSLQRDFHQHLLFPACSGKAWRDSLDQKVL